MLNLCFLAPSSRSRSICTTIRARFRRCAQAEGPTQQGQSMAKHILTCMSTADMCSRRHHNRSASTLLAHPCSTMEEFKLCMTCFILRVAHDDECGVGLIARGVFTLVCTRRRWETQVRQCCTKILAYSLWLGKVRDAYTGGSRLSASREDDRHSAQRRTSDTLRMRLVMRTSTYSPRGL